MSNVLFTCKPDGIQFQIKVNPNATKNQIGEIALDRQGRTYVKISINCAPIDNKANKALIEFLANTWKLKKKQIQIKQGSANKNKLIHIAGDPKYLLSHLQSFI